MYIVPSNRAATGEVGTVLACNKGYRVVSRNLGALSETQSRALNFDTIMKNSEIMLLHKCPVGKHQKTGELQC